MKTCISCHNDFHNGNNGKECQLCHNTNNWIITNGVEIHQSSRFPLIGPHVSADCGECHKSSSPLEFQPLNVDCYSCHSQDYLMKQVPNHLINNLPKNKISVELIGGSWLNYIKGNSNVKKRLFDKSFKNIFYQEYFKKKTLPKISKPSPKTTI